MNITSAQLNQYAAFTQFANQRVKADDRKAVASLSQIGNNNVEVIKNSSDKPYAFTRSRLNKDLNNEVRSLFRETVASLFGGENKIPQSVKKAMSLGDYGKGRPLTAKRIAAVDKAILNYLFSSHDGITVDGQKMTFTEFANVRNGRYDDNTEMPNATIKLNRQSNAGTINTTGSIKNDDDEASEINTSEKKPEQPVSPEQTEYNALKSKGFEKLSMAEKKRYFELEGKLNSKGFTTYLGVGGVRPGAGKSAGIVQDNFDPTDKDKEVKKLDEVKVVTGKKKRNIKPFTFEG